jgi:hypothetical protein
MAFAPLAEKLLSLLPARNSFAMLSFFKRITPEQVLAQQHAVAEQVSNQAAQQRAAHQRAELTKRKPGRPKRALDAADMLTAAASAPLDGEQTANKRGKYHNW